MARHIALIFVLTLAISCGQAGGGSGDLAEGGIGGSGISTGPITQFGSIFVNDIEWNLDDSDIEFDGEIGSEDLFRLGMVVRVEGEIDADAGTGQAARVFYDDELEGPVSEIENVTGVGLPGQYRDLTVFGQRVRIEAGVTRFGDDEDDDSDFGFNTIAVGDVVEVSGLVDDESAVRATYVERKGEVEFGNTNVEIKGTVAGLVAGVSFTIGTITIDLDANTDVSDLPGDTLEEGMFVEVEGVLTAADRVLALEIELEDDFDDDDAEDYSITGYVRDFVSLADFFVGNQRVDASGAEFEHGTASMLQNGRRVEVEGDVVGGILVADEVEFEDQEVKIHAQIAAAEDVDLAHGRLTLLGVPIQIIPSTQFEDSRDDIEPFGLEDLVVGDFVEVEGIANAQGVITAFEVERDETDDIRLRGPVEAFDAATGEIVILGVSVATGGITNFEIEDVGVGSVFFFQQLEVGDFVGVRDDTGSATAIDLATKVELES